MGSRTCDGRGPVMARRSRLEEFTDKERATLLNSLRAGNFRTTACAAVGISTQTLRNWVDRARAGEEPYADFVADLEQVEALAEVETANVIAMCARGEVPKDKDGNVIPEEERPFRDWKAAAFLLERRGARRWAPTLKSELTGKDGEALIPAEPSPEAAAALLRLAFGDHARRALQEDSDDAAKSELEPEGARVKARDAVDHVLVNSDFGPVPRG